MFIHYYELRNENVLPPGAYFEDPIDGSQYYTKEKESLGEFINRITKTREEKGLLELSEDSLKTLVTISLSETVKDKQLDRYFVRKSMNPSVSQVISAAKTLITQRIRGKQASYNTRQSRASACLGCSLHDSKSRFSWALSKAITAAASLEAIQQSESERRLGTCKACGCGLQEKIRFDISPIIASLGPTDIFNILKVYESKSFSHCWMLKEANSEPATKDLLKRKVDHLPNPYNAMLQVYEAEMIQRAKKNGRR